LLQFQLFSQHIGKRTGCRLLASLRQVNPGVFFAQVDLDRAAGLSQFGDMEGGRLFTVLAFHLDLPANDIFVVATFQVAIASALVLWTSWKLVATF
jgi:hypothetical protein